MFQGEEDSSLGPRQIKYPRLVHPVASTTSTTDYNCNNVLVVTQSRRPFEIESPPNKRWDDKPFRGQEIKAASTATASATTQVPNDPNPPKIRALDVISRVFPSKLRQLHRISDHCITFIFKILSNCCRHNYDLSISRIFWNLIFGGFLLFRPTALPQPQPQPLEAQELFNVPHVGASLCAITNFG